MLVSGSIVLLFDDDMMRKRSAPSSAAPKTPTHHKSRVPVPAAANTIAPTTPTPSTSTPSGGGTSSSPSYSSSSSAPSVAVLPTENPSEAIVANPPSAAVTMPPTPAPSGHASMVRSDGMMILAGSGAVVIIMAAVFFSWLCTSRAIAGTQPGGTDGVALLGNSGSGATDVELRDRGNRYGSVSQGAGARQ